MIVKDSTEKMFARGQVDGKNCKNLKLGDDERPLSLVPKKWMIN